MPEAERGPAPHLSTCLPQGYALPFNVRIEYALLDRISTMIACLLRYRGSTKLTFPGTFAKAFASNLGIERGKGAR